MSCPSLNLNGWAASLKNSLLLGPWSVLMLQGVKGRLQGGSPSLSSSPRVTLGAPGLIWRGREALGFPRPLGSPSTGVWVLLSPHSAGGLPVVPHYPLCLGPERESLNCFFTRYPCLCSQQGPAARSHVHGVPQG